MSDHGYVLILISYCLIREVFFMIHTQKLVNKIMSKNYYDFQISKEAGKITQSEPNYLKETGMPEDMGVLQGFAP